MLTPCTRFPVKSDRRTSSRFSPVAIVPNQIAPPMVRASFRTNELPSTIASRHSPMESAAPNTVFE